MSENTPENTATELDKEIDEILETLGAKKMSGEELEAASKELDELDLDSLFG